MIMINFIATSLLYGIVLVTAGTAAFQLGRAIGEASLRSSPPPRDPTLPTPQPRREKP